MGNRNIYAYINVDIHKFHILVYIDNLEQITFRLTEFDDTNGPISVLLHLRRSMIAFKISLLIPAIGLYQNSRSSSNYTYTFIVL